MKTRNPSTSRNGIQTNIPVETLKTSSHSKVPDTSRDAKWKDAPVEDIEDQQQHVWNNGSWQVRLEVQTYDRLPHHQLPKLSIEGLHGIPTTIVWTSKGRRCAFQPSKWDPLKAAAWSYDHRPQPKGKGKGINPRWVRPRKTPMWYGQLHSSCSCRLMHDRTTCCYKSMLTESFITRLTTQLTCM